VKRVAIIQPSYVPWRGYFDIIHSVDVFIFLDDVQYTVRDWRNRNRVRRPDGTSQWITVPTIGGRDQRLCDVLIDQSQGWARKHAETLRYSYGRTPFFERYHPRFVEVLGRRHERLADLDIELTRQICEWLDINVEFHRSSALGASGSKGDRLIDLVTRVGGGHYLSGPSARDYIRPEQFAAAGIELAYQDYSGYPEYTQISYPFDGAVTILDLLFAVGPDAGEYIWGGRRARGVAGGAVRP
jgi:hypothetical protein